MRTPSSLRRSSRTARRWSARRRCRRSRRSSSCSRAVRRPDRQSGRSMTSHPPSRPSSRRDSSRPALAEPFHARAADNRVAAVVGEPHPRLALAVVVGRPDDERRVAAADAAALRPLRLGPAPYTYERVLLPLAADRRLVGVAREDARLRRWLHQDVPYRAAELAEVAAADRI